MSRNNIQISLRSMIYLVLVGSIFAGIISGFLESYYAFQYSALDIQTLLQVLITSATVLALCSIASAIIITALIYLAHWHISFTIKSMLVLIGGICLFWYYPFYQALALIFPAAAVSGYYTISRRSSLHLGCFILWIILVVILKSLFAGHAMTLTFTEWQTTMMVAAAGPVLLGLTYIIMGPLCQVSSNKFSWTVASVIAAAIAVFFAFSSSIFLIRLWGFHTLVYLQVTLLFLQMALLLVPITFLFRLLLPPKWSRTRLIFGLISFFSVILSMALYVPSAMKQNAASKIVLESLPHASFIVRTLASMVDRDKDGFSPLYGFGDCDDSNPKIHPLALDIPNSVIDENCLGGDLKEPTHSYFNAKETIIVPGTAATNDRKKIVVFLVVDTLRADALQLKPSVTPVLNKIESESTTFTDTYAASNNTLESFPFLLQASFRRLPVASKKLALSTLLRAGNIHSTAIFQSSVEEWWPEKLGKLYFDFDSVHRPPTTVRNIPVSQVIDTALSELSTDKQQNRLLFIHFESLHDSATTKMEGQRIVKDGLNFAEILSFMNIDKVAEGFKHNYLKTLNEIDAALEPLWQRLKQLENKHDILFVITSDHGEEFYEHGGLFHMNTLYNEVLKVPLVIYQNKKPPVRIDTPIGMYQILPTILDFLDFKGSYIQKLTLDRPKHEPLDIFSYFSLQHRYHKKVLMVMIDNVKLIYNANTGRSQLFDLKNDPKEKNDIYDNKQYREKLLELEVKMDTLLYYLNYGDLTPR